MHSTTTLTFPVDSVIKQKAKEKVERQGFGFDLFMGAVVTELLRNFVERKVEKKVMRIRLEKPTRYFRQAIRKAREERKAGKASPVFDTAEDAIAWLHR